MIETTISVSEPSAYIIFFLILLIFTVLSFTVGRRGFCHTLCWIAPFMIIGRKLRNLVPWSSLRLRSAQELCVDCARCTENCPMSLDVNGMVHSPTMENTECILCGTCVDVCPNDVIQFVFRSGI
jgi:ferredoxin-type protein NapH